MFADQGFMEKEESRGRAEIPGRVAYLFRINRLRGLRRAGLEAVEPHQRPFRGDPRKRRYKSLGIKGLRRVEWEWERPSRELRLLARLHDVLGRDESLCGNGIDRRGNCDLSSCCDGPMT